MKTVCSFIHFDLLTKAKTTLNCATHQTLGVVIKYAPIVFFCNEVGIAKVTRWSIGAWSWSFKSAVKRGSLQRG